MQKEQKQGIGRNGKNLLKDKSRKKSLQRVNSFTADRKIKGSKESKWSDKSEKKEGGSSRNEF